GVAYLLVTRIYGFESGDNPGTQPDEAARFLMTIVPPILMVISFAFSWLINFKQAPASPPPGSTGAPAEPGQE
ncbi:MAG: MFS transporter, partial [Chloroflexi bacterium]|nr:MFS transporter [Chloroflexota bacterium]